MRLRAAAFGRVRDLGIAGGEELLFLQLYPLPGRVAEHTGKATGPAFRSVGAIPLSPYLEDLREFQVPMKETVNVSQAFGLSRWFGRGWV